MSRIYHLLDEAEQFSERKGGAISRWTANVLRDGPEVIVCPSFDSTWGFPEERLHTLPGWRHTDPPHPILYRLPWPLQRAAYLRIFKPLFDLLKPGDLLWVHNRPECAAVLATVARQRGFRLVLHMHNSHMVHGKQAWRRALLDTPLVFCSEWLHGEFQQKWPGHRARTTVVLNGADGRKFRVADRSTESPDKTPEVIFTGRLVPYKGAHILLGAMRILEARGVKARCTVVGSSGFAKQRKTKYIRRMEATRPANAELIGYRSGEALAELLRGADVYCCPSIWNDPFPLAPLEGMASGLPVVASRSGGIPEELRYGGGVLVEPNDPVALADGLQPLLENRELRLQLGEQAVQSFREHFLWSHVRTQYDAAVERLFA